MTRRDRDDGDVIVVGGGISGMSAAKALHERGLDVHVVEANDRVGGRTWTDSAPGGPIDYGGMFIGDAHVHLTELGRELGLEMTPSGKPGADVYVVSGNVLHAVEGRLGATVPFSAELDASFEAIDALGRTVGSAAPWAAPPAAALDAKTVATWLDETCSSEDVKEFHRVTLNVVLGGDPAEVSLLFWAYYVDACGGMGALMGTQDGAQNAWWIGGAAQVSWRIAERLGARVTLGHPVNRIEQTADRVVVHSGPRRWTATYAIVAMPPMLANRIAFEPEPSIARARLQMREAIGRCAKVQARYPTPFWLEAGLSGAIVDTSEVGAFVLDGTKPTDDLATLVGFIGGSHFDSWLSLPATARRGAFLALLAKAFGGRAENPSYYHEATWIDQRWTPAPLTFFAPGVFARFGAALRQPVGRIHFAGTEAASQWPGFMEGGVRAGQRAAADVVRLLAV